MKRIISAVGIFLATVVFAMGQDSKPVKAEPTAPIRSVFETLVEGIRKADAAKVMSVYNESQDTLFFNNNGTVTLGWEQMKSNRESAYAKVSNVSLETSGVRIRMLGTRAAYLTCKWKQTQETEGKIEAASGRMTLVFRLIGKDWKIVHAHTSPDVPDTSRPVLQSERATQ